MAAPPAVRQTAPWPKRSEAPANFSAMADAVGATMPNTIDDINLSITWTAAQVAATQDYKTAAAQSAASAAQSSASAVESKNAAEAALAAIGSAAGLPSFVGNARRPLAVLLNETGVVFSEHIKALYIEPVAKKTVTGAVALDLSVGSIFPLTLTGNTNVTFSKLPTLSASEGLVVILRVTQGDTAFSFTLPSSVIWISSGGLPPTAPNARNTAEYLLTFEGGAVYGRKGSAT